MQLLVLSGSAVRGVLGYARCAEAMRAALVARARGEVFQPLRSVIKPDGAAGFMGLMPAYQSGSAAAYGLKAICVTPANPAAGLDAHQGIVLLSDAATGQPQAVLNASAVTEIRTAAVSAVATELLARPEADVLAIVGTGVQARAHLMAVSATRPLAEVRIAGRTPEKAARFAADVAPAALAEVDAQAPDEQMPHAADATVVACRSAADAVRGAGIVVTATSSAVPVIVRDWLDPGTHLNAVGACLPHARELDTATVACARLYADSRESVLAESGDYLLAAADGAIGPDHIRAEIGDLLAGLADGHGRSDAAEITVFESLGLAAEDLAAAVVAYRAALEDGAGAWLDFD
ncbi:MAG TPA: ornithine cyclodeaminase family protein [Streptosporangiaceae bacterium]|nr:ornithine cyclodeaminase family protein [Streptosporangiaceae bacterium]